MIQAVGIHIVIELIHDSPFPHKGKVISVGPDCLKGQFKLGDTVFYGSGHNSDAFPHG